MKPFKIILFSKDEAYQKITEGVERFGEQIDLNSLRYIKNNAERVISNMPAVRIPKQMGSKDEETKL